jgi:hypothetical protein
VRAIERGPSPPHRAAASRFAYVALLVSVIIVTIVEARVVFR